MVKKKYKTEQRKDLLDYMIKNTENFVNADDIEKYLKNKKISIGLTTIYRFLNSLEKQGKVRVELKDHTKYYQYILEECTNHFHLQCKKCGKIVEIVNKGCPALVCCGEEMTEIRSGLQAGDSVSWQAKGTGKIE